MTINGKKWPYQQIHVAVDGSVPY